MTRATDEEIFAMVDTFEKLCMELKESRAKLAKYEKALLAIKNNHSYCDYEQTTRPGKRCIDKATEALG